MRCVLSVFSCFFFYSYSHPCDFHSFPTRRSSDLLLQSLHDLRRGDLFIEKRRVRFVTSVFQFFDRDEMEGGRVNDRSEEHTSELQSHHDLVCRLLLEKKKKIIQTILLSKYLMTSQ